MNDNAALEFGTKSRAKIKYRLNISLRLAKYRENRHGLDDRHQMSDVFSNPAYVGGQAQNLTGEIIPLGGSVGYSGGSAASGSGVSDSGGFSNPNALQLTISNYVPPAPTTPTSGAGTQSGTAGSPGAPSGTAGGSLSATVNDYFVRAIIIILGMIFVAVGLSMFKGQGQTGLLAPVKHAV
jgi:hypothetical protein